MCGIYGAAAFSHRGKIFINKYKPRLEQTSRLRGRDGHGRYEWGWGYIGVSRAQPLPEADDIPLPLQEHNLVMVYNGTLSNDRDLIEKYNLPFKEVDTYTAINLWAILGWKCCEEFVGGFAFGVYNKKSDLLTIAKNFKTLWFVKTKDYFLFASEKEFLIFQDSDHIFTENYPRRFPQNYKVTFNHSGIAKTKKIKRKFWSSTPDLDPNKSVVVISGGIDSTTSAYIGKKIYGHDLTLIHFDYGQLSNNKEKEAVENISKDLKVPAEFVDLTNLGKWGSSPLTDSSINLPLGMLSVESTLCWTPARNMLMIAYAAAFAEAKGIKWIYYGNNMEEEATGYSDNDLEFIYLYNELLDYGTLKGVKIKRVLGRVMKPEILHIGTYLQVPYDKTWSCDQGFSRPCGVCGCCTTRRYAFKRAGLTDSQTYLDQKLDPYPWTNPKQYKIQKLLGLVK